MYYEYCLRKTDLNTKLFTVLNAKVSFAKLNRTKNCPIAIHVHKYFLCLNFTFDIYDVSVVFALFLVSLEQNIRREIVFAAGRTAERVTNLVFSPQMVHQRCFLLEDLAAYLADELKTQVQEQIRSSMY